MNHFIDQTQNNNYGYDILRGYSTPYLSVILALIYYLYLTKEIVMRGVIFFFERLINLLIVLEYIHKLRLDILAFDLACTFYVVIWHFSDPLPPPKCKCNL